MPAREGCVLIFGRRSRIAVVVPAAEVVVLSMAEDIEVGVRVRARARGWREGRRGVRMLKVLGEG